MKKIFLIAALTAGITVCAQKKDVISVAEVTRIEKALAADDMQGRRAGTPGSDKAAAFIAAEFKKAGLQPLKGASFLQTFTVLQPVPLSASGTIDGTPLPPQNIIAITTQPQLTVNEASNYTIAYLKAGENLRNRINEIMSAGKNTVVFVDTSFQKNFVRLNSLRRQTIKNDNSTEPAVNLVFVLGNYTPQAFTLTAQHNIEEVKLSNVVGMLPGKSKKEEQVIFSGHYDHLGIGKPVNGDSIYNGANDDAAGITAVITLAQYYKKMANNGRTLVFAAFTAEETGGYGSQYFSQQLDPKNVAAMFNIEMIGTESKWGKASAYITGFDKTNMGAILQKNLKGSPFTFHPDPYPEQQLFYRSDNATLARLGVPAHTISTSKMDNEPNYHKVSDEVSTLDLQNMAQIIKAIAVSAGTIVSGTDTPTRVKVEDLR